MGGSQTQASQQKNLVDNSFPFNLFITDVPEFPPHWHTEIEIVYSLEGQQDIGLNNRVYTLEPRDILLVGMGDVHYFLHQSAKNKRIIIQFKPNLVEGFTPVFRKRRFIQPLIKSHTASEANKEIELHKLIEKQILTLSNEYFNKQEGYKLAILARLYDLVLILLRQVPYENISSIERNKHLKRLERLEQVFQFVEQNFGRPISLEEVSQVANFSVYHFTRFFKETTGMTFLQYLNNYRVAKAEIYLTDTTDSITEVAFKAGFRSIKTFNRVFKKLKGCSPSQYQKEYLRNYHSSPNSSDNPGENDKKSNF